MPRTAEARLAELGINLPDVAVPVAAYVPAVQTGRYVYTSGQLPFTEGALPATGKVGDEPISKYTRAKLFQEKGKRTPLFVRFSTVIHGGHSPENSSLASSAHVWGSDVLNAAWAISIAAAPAVRSGSVVRSDRLNRKPPSSRQSMPCSGRTQRTVS
jgi:hypothetical protein